MRELRIWGNAFDERAEALADSNLDNLEPRLLSGSVLSVMVDNLGTANRSSLNFSESKSTSSVSSSGVNCGGRNEDIRCSKEDVVEELSSEMVTLLREGDNRFPSD